MKILAERFFDEKQAKQFWDKSIFDMLDVAFFLTDCGLSKQGKEFCDIFANQNVMAVVANYKFNFELVKKFLGVPSIYVARNTNLDNLQDVTRDKTLCVKDERLAQKYADVTSVLQKELDIAKKEILGLK